VKRTLLELEIPLKIREFSVFKWGITTIDNLVPKYHGLDDE
jgi:hypothetical protein